jgi:hypothetical protein
LIISANWVVGVVVASSVLAAGRDLVSDLGVAPLEGVADRGAVGRPRPERWVAGGVAVVGGSPVTMPDAMKVTFGALSVLKVTFMALTTTPLASPATPGRSSS